MGFTLPSALLLIAFALGVGAIAGPAAVGAIHGLKVVAVAVVAQAVWGMAKSLCADRPRADIALAAAVLAVLLPGAGGQLGAIALGGLVARRALQVAPLPAERHLDYGVSRRQGAVLLALLEWSNPRTMGGLSVPGKIMAALFQSVSTRTAGMNTIDLAACSPISKLLMSVLQFIGAAPGSTGGGVKVTTFAVLILTIRSVAQGRDDCVIGGHHIESKTVYRALTIIVIGAVAAFGSAVVVYYNTAETVSVIDCIFESCSAFGTVGLSVGVTGQLNTGAKLLYMACMFMGRVGPVSLAISLTAKPDDNKRKVLPVGHINVG